MVYTDIEHYPAMLRTITNTQIHTNRVVRRTAGGKRRYFHKDMSRKVREWCYRLQGKGLSHIR